MTLLTIAIPVALLVATGAVIAFIWAARTDQFEDLDTPPRRMLLDDAPVVRGSVPAPPAAALPSAHGRDRVPPTNPR
jgi:cbb3-type cytochrome oxidase maturation protein